MASAPSSDFYSEDIIHYLTSNSPTSSNEVISEKEVVGVALQEEEVGVAELLHLEDPLLVRSIVEELSSSAASCSKNMLGGSKTDKKKRFASAKTKKEIVEARKAGVPKKTQDDTIYCYKVWEEWRGHRNSNGERQVPEITTMDTMSLNDCLCSFILEMRKKDGTEYPPNTIHHIVCGIMRYLRQNGKPGIDFFKDVEFSDFRLSMDAEMKRLQSQGIGIKRHQAEPLTEVEEELLWQSGQLGDHSPQALLNTIFYMCGIYFALRSGQEHRNLRHHPPQIELIEREGERAYLKYSEDISKNNPGGLKARKKKPKIVNHHENPANPDRCFARLFKLYRSKCPPNRPNGAFYLKPAIKSTETCWYSVSPVGHTTLAGMVARMCRSAGIAGYKTNHSLRATAATRLYQAGIDEQLIMERTGHHSLEGVRSYKRTNSEQQENISDIISLSKKRHVSSSQNALLPSTAFSSPVPFTHHSMPVPPNPVPVTHHPVPVTHSSSQVQNLQLKANPENLKNMFTFNNCSGVNIHVHF